MVIVRRLALVVVSLLFLAVVLEGVLRAREAEQRRITLAGRSAAELGTVAAEPPLLYTLKPGWKAEFNSQGFRDLERSKEKDADSFRLAVVGDSVTMQLDVPFEKLYVRRLERLLNKAVPDHRIECPAFAVTGYNLAQELELMKRTVMEYQPDAILWQFHLNDASDPVIDGDNGGLGRYYARPRFQVWASLRRRVDHIERRRWLKRHFPELEQRDLQIQAWRWDQTTSLINQVVQLARSKRIPVFVAVFPSFPEGGDWQRYSKADMELYRALIERFEVAGCATLDLMPIFKTHAIDEIQRAVDDPWHPSVRGHAVMARALSRWLIGSNFQTGSITSRPPM